MRAKLTCGALAAVLFSTALGTVASADEKSASAPAISDIRQETTERATRLSVECTAPLAYTYYSPDPLTLVVDLPEVDASKIPARINVGSREVESVRMTNMARADGRSITRMEVRLASLVPYQIYSKDKTLNLVFERSGAAAAATAPAPAAAAPAPKVETIVASVPKLETPPPVDTGSKAAAPELVAVAASAPQPSAVSAPVEEATVASGSKATRILGVSSSRDGEQLAVTIKADGSLHYQDFFLGNPDRLVVDFKDVTSKAALRTLEVNDGPVKKVRIAQFSAASPKVARLVLDLSSRAPYHIVEGRDGVKILFGEGGRTPSPAPLAALRVEPAAGAALAYAPAALAPPAPAPVPVLPDPQLGGGREAFEAKSLGAPQKVYTGHPINLDFKDGDLQDIFRLFADISGLNVVVNPGVSGKVTLKLTEVPWDQALDLILKTNGLGYTLDDNVIRIARLADLQKEEGDRRKLREEQELAGDLVDLTKRISYAKATDIQGVLKQAGAISPRGQVNIDSRTNTLIIRDLAKYLEKAKGLIAELDVATPQVEIEARVIVTSRNFTRDLGIQWGFLNQQTTQFGNTTNLSFPHSIILNGQGTPGAGLPADQAGLAPPAGIGTSGRGYAVNLPAGGFNTSLGISLGNILGSFNLDAALTALERQGRGRVLSTPKVTTQNNKTAEIKQGVQIPIQTTANNTISVTFKDAVLGLKVTPQITDAGTVILELELENNTPDFANAVGGIPPINTQSAKTIVLVRDGQTAVVGGIYKSQEQTSANRTPFLSNLPVLGYLFRSKSVTTTNDELLLFITPRIVKG
jgi:type IV pilus secretin PilQ/predicted competence protein